jgi:hypothetical protein
MFAQAIRASRQIKPSRRPRRLGRDQTTGMMGGLAEQLASKIHPGYSQTETSDKSASPTRAEEVVPLAVRLSEKG